MIFRFLIDRIDCHDEMKRRDGKATCKIIKYRARRRRCGVLQLHKQLSSFSLFSFRLSMGNWNESISVRLLPNREIKCQNPRSPNYERFMHQLHGKISPLSGTSTHRLPRCDLATPKSPPPALEPLSCHCIFLRHLMVIENYVSTSRDRFFIEFNLHLYASLAEITISAWVFFSRSRAFRFCAYSVDRKPYTHIKWMAFYTNFPVHGNVQLPSSDIVVVVRLRRLRNCDIFIVAALVVIIFSLVFGFTWWMITCFYSVWLRFCLAVVFPPSQVGEKIWFPSSCACVLRKSHLQNMHL